MSEILKQTVGRRKEASARVRLIAGTGVITVNDKPLAEYFIESALRDVIFRPLALLGRDKQYDVTVKVAGGGRHGQADGIAHGIAKALNDLDAESRPVLKRAGLLTRDPRSKERKKPGKKRARKSPQWSKR